MSIQRSTFREKHSNVNPSVTLKDKARGENLIQVVSPLLINFDNHFQEKKIF